MLWATHVEAFWQRFRTTGLEKEHSNAQGDARIWNACNLHWPTKRLSASECDPSSTCPCSSRCGTPRFVKNPIRSSQTSRLRASQWGSTGPWPCSSRCGTPSCGNARSGHLPNRRLRASGQGLHRQRPLLQALWNAKLCNAASRFCRSGVSALANGAKPAPSPVPAAYARLFAWPRRCKTRLQGLPSIRAPGLRAIWPVQARIRPPAKPQGAGLTPVFRR